MLLLLVGLYCSGGVGGGGGWKKDHVRLQQSAGQLLNKRKVFQRLMAGLVISRCTGSASEAVILKFRT